MLRVELERRNKRLTQAALGRESGVHPTTVSQIESGRVVATPEELRRFADVLGYEGDPCGLGQEVIPQGQAEDA